MSVTLVHPAKAVGRNEMLFGRETRMVPSNFVLDRGLGPSTEKREIWVELGIETHSQNMHCKLRQKRYR